MNGRPFPLVWILLGHRTGDNAQAIELARRLGWPAEQKRLVYNGARIVPNLIQGGSLRSLDPACLPLLAPPWPDMVIAVGKRSVPVARWIRNKAGGNVRLVQLGRPRAPLSWFDLVVTTPQYGLPPASNLVELPLPLVPPAKPDESEVETWARHFAHLARPWTGVLVGGSRHPSLFGPAEARKLAEELNRQPGALLVSTSPRTGTAAAAALRGGLTVPHDFHEWRAASPNPHRAILHLADRFIVTSDSVSMIAEAATTGKPVTIFADKVSPFALSWQARRGLPAMLARVGLLSPPRDPARIRLPAPPGADQEVLRRIRAWFAV